MRDDLRVLVVTTSLAPDALQTWHAASRLEGVDLHIAGSLTTDPSDAFKERVARPTWGTVHVLRPSGLLRGRDRLWWELDGLERLIGELRPDVVHVHSEIWGRLVTQALRGGAPVVVHGAENISLSHGGRLEGSVRASIARRNLHRAAGYVSWNAEGVRLMKENGLPSDAPTAVAPAVVPDPDLYLRARRVSPRRTARVGYVGRLVPEKGIHWLIEALDGTEGCELVVIGAGDYRGVLERQAERRGVPVEFVGSLTREALPQALVDLDVVVVPSLPRPGWTEQFGRIVAESMLVGVPVVSSDSGALVEVVGDGGLVVPSHDRGALRDAIRALLVDEPRRRRLGEQGRRWALEHLVPDAAAAALQPVWATVAVRAA